VAIARALMNRPDILLADEPTSDLDAQTEMEIVEILQKIHMLGVTVIMVTHNLDLIPYATRALKIENGRSFLLKADRQKQSRSALIRIRICIYSVHSRNIQLVILP